MKSIFKSKTVWIAILQAVASVVIVAFTELDMVGYVGIVKSALDIATRMITSQGIK